MATAADSALLNQILTTLNSLGERLAAVEADLKTVIDGHRDRLSDHEARIRVLESGSPQVMTRTAFDEIEARRADAAEVAANSQNRRTNTKLAIAGLVLSVVIIAANVWTSIHIPH